MSAFRDIRVIPVVAAAIFGLAVLKVAGLVIDGGYVFDVRRDKKNQMLPPVTRISSTAHTSSSGKAKTQNIASAGARGVNPDRDAVGGPNKKRVPVKIGPGDVAEFQKGIA